MTEWRYGIRTAAIQSWLVQLAMDAGFSEAARVEQRKTGMNELELNLVGFEKADVQFACGRAVTSRFSTQDDIRLLF
jgi:hypothetical protein